MIILVRHTRVAVPPGTIYGQSDVALAESFETEAAAVLHRIIDLLDKHRTKAARHALPARMHSSPLSRCARLARHLEAALLDAQKPVMNFEGPIAFDDRLREMNFGDWENRTWSEISKLGGREWGENWQSQTTPNGEGFLQLYDRAVAFIDELASRPDASSRTSVDIVVTHSGIIRCLNTHARGLPKQEAFSLNVDFGAVLLLQPPRR